MCVCVYLVCGGWFEIEIVQVWTKYYCILCILVTNEGMYQEWAQFDVSDDGGGGDGGGDGPKSSMSYTIFMMTTMLMIMMMMTLIMYANMYIPFRRFYIQKIFSCRLFYSANTQIPYNLTCLIQSSFPIPHYSFGAEGWCDGAELNIKKVSPYM